MSLISIFGIMVIIFLAQFLPNNLALDFNRPLHPDILNQQNIYNNNFSKNLFYENIKSFFSLNWGYSLYYQDFQVIFLIKEAIKKSSIIIIISFSMFLILSTFVQFIYHLKLNYFWKMIFNEISLVLISLPTLLISPLLIYIFIFKLNLFPLLLDESLYSYILPSFCLILRPSAQFFRQFNKNLEENKTSQFVTYAKAKGLSKNEIFFKYRLYPQLGILIVLCGQVLLSLITGNFFVEYLFSIPGLGQLFVISLENKDIPVIVSLSFVFIVLVMLIRIFQNILISQVNPIWRINENT